MEIAPNYNGYKGGYDNVNYCVSSKCNTQGLYEDLHCVNPCPYCGSKVIDGKRVGKWIKPEYRWNKFLGIPIYRELITTGYWLIKEET